MENDKNVEQELKDWEDKILSQPEPKPYTKKQIKQYNQFRDKLMEEYERVRKINNEFLSKYRNLIAKVDLDHQSTHEGFSGFCFTFWASKIQEEAENTSL